MSTVTSNLRTVAAKAENLRERTADTLKSAADTIREKGNEGASAITGLTGEAGRKLDSAAALVRNGRTQRWRVFGLRNQIRRNPMQSVAVAAVAGLVAGLSCRGSR